MKPLPDQFKLATQTCVLSHVNKSATVLYAVLADLIETCYGNERNIIFNLKDGVTIDIYD